MTAPFPLRDFVEGRLHTLVFDHRAHIQAAFELLQRHDFDEAAHLYARAVRAMAASAGQPAKFHMTITIAMLSAIAERLPQERVDFADFADAHPELFDRRYLVGHYTEGRLESPLARRTFLLPDRPCP